MLVLFCSSHILVLDHAFSCTCASMSAYTLAIMLIRDLVSSYISMPSLFGSDTMRIIQLI